MSGILAVLMKIKVGESNGTMHFERMHHTPAVLKYSGNYFLVTRECFAKYDTSDT